MSRRSVADWLRWQESLHTHRIALGLERVREVALRLGSLQAPGPVFTVAGTNGKGSTVALLEAFLRQAGLRPGVYTSPHLVRYHERIRSGGREVDDTALLAAFERVEAARGATALTFFEFGTLAALEVFRAQGCDAWVLEVGMGGRLDAVNVVDADYALITTVDLDHQEFLGDTIEEIAAEKAGIMRSGRAAFYGDWPAPDAVRRAAEATGARLHCLGELYDFTPSTPTWSWRGQATTLDGLAWPRAASLAQLRNASLVLAVLEQYRPVLLGDVAAVNGIISTVRPPGRFQLVAREHEWILDVAHNPQAAVTLRAQLDALPPAPETTVVIGILGDKNLDGLVAELEPLATRWVCCTVEDARARAAGAIARRLRERGMRDVSEADDPASACVLARARTPVGGRILVCGSFRVVGPALEWLGIY
jgi:dihydrofolate synthase/folylpolyglutamate synthase